ncbi:MAG: DUF167 domain-containing protein [Hyphomicrobiaceae bacterium]|nr:DUF167 domain-containing protein [Hyphomicrobiaceae bacterium]
MAKPAGIVVRVRLTPKAARDGIDGWQALADGSRVLAARVRAVPEKGLANMALERLIAEAAGVGRTAVSVVAGGTSRIKSVRIETAEAEASILARLATGSAGPA